MVAHLARGLGRAWELEAYDVHSYMQATACTCSACIVYHHLGFIINLIPRPQLLSLRQPALVIAYIDYSATSKTIVNYFSFARTLGDPPIRQQLLQLRESRSVIHR